MLGDLGLNRSEQVFDFFLPGSYAELQEQALAMMNVPLIALCYDANCPVDFYYQVGNGCLPAYITVDFSTGITNDGIKGFSGKMVTDSNSLFFYEGYVKETTMSGILKERIEFNTEATLEVLMTSDRQAKFGLFPVFQFWQYTTGDLAEKIEVPFTVDESTATKKFIFYLPGVPGFTILA
ncbi:hypothetical protein [Paracoccus sp. (in: a-proteobacteria)]|uniref:hypothetical protein n=1 Tax=Paracoccus sp. TaxID=267 RepID=UPI00321F81DF